MRNGLLEPKNAVALDYEPPLIAPRAGLRWWICALLFFATTVNYIDRQVIGVLKPTLSAQLGWSETDYANIVFWFQVAYAAGYLCAGRLMDRIGLRIGYTIAILLWSLAAMAHGLMGLVNPAAKFELHFPGMSHALVLVPMTVFGFSVARFLLGISEGGNFPAAIKAVSEWFPRKERAFATGLFNAGANVGAIITPLTVPWITLHLGWPVAFVITGALGLICAFAWLFLYKPLENHPRISPAEKAHILSDPPEPTVYVRWVDLLGYRATWAIIVGMALSAPIWWFYLYWVPDFLFKQYKIDLKNIGLPLVTIYLISDFGSIAGGWMSSKLIKIGWTVNAARKSTLLLCALCVVPVYFAAHASNQWTATLLIGLAAAAHQGFSANLFTLVSDTMPRYTVSSVVGIGGFAGAIAGMFFAKLVGYLLDATHSYSLIFAIAPAAYLVALFVIHLLVHKLEPVEIRESIAR